MKKEGAVRNEEIKELRKKARDVSKKSSPDLNIRKRVVNDRNTTIHVNKGEDAVEAKKKCIAKMQNRKYNVHYKNYDVGDEG